MILFSPPKLSPVPNTGLRLGTRKLFVLEEDFALSYHGLIITVPKGRRTDFASVPRWLQWLLPDAAILSVAAIVHDWLYFTGHIDREVADALFHALLRAERVPWFHRTVMWFALIAAGATAWNRHRKLGHPERNVNVF
jgi:hypothetical protein